ncbi:MAG TPA: FAD-binding oxidoreductase [Verrucomicrobiae bacterium]|nr:FAD-binding oxidoreductase [Verrucomicrobiae bacterium]
MTPDSSLSSVAPGFQRLTPADKKELSRALAAADRERQPIRELNLTRLNRVLWFTPEDMTVKVETGITLQDLQTALARSKQWLPIDPPHPETLTIAELLATNVSGPRRFGHGTIREHLIGLQVALADGRLASSGGNVVKNVAGYDLMKLFIGARHSLGFAVEATFKLLPLPQAEAFVQSQPVSFDEAERLTVAVLDSELVPVSLDWHGPIAAPALGVSGVGQAQAQAQARVVMGFAGTAEDVPWQVRRAAALGLTEPANLNYEREFWEELGAAAQTWAVLPSRLARALSELKAVRFVARAGQGLIHYTGGMRPPVKETDPGVRALSRRIKDTFDPLHILPELPA